MLNIEKARILLGNETISSKTLINDCFEKIEDEDGQGGLTFISCFKVKAMKQAQRYDALRKSGSNLPPFAGIPISIKDLFDIEGQVTTAGSVVMRDQSPANKNAPVIERLINAGFIILGRTNMTEFAYSGLGLNPHYGTPLNPYDRDIGRIPGGSSSGAAISVTDGFVAAGLGTDTGGSCRIPAALCGIVGFKPTQSRVPLDGAIPLSHSLDSIGPLAETVQSCAIIDAVLSDKKEHTLENISLSGLKFALPVKPMLDDMDHWVSSAFERALTILSKAGAIITEINLPELSSIPQQSKNGGLAAAEAYAWHKDRLTTSYDQYDPRVASRIMNWEKAQNAEYEELLDARSRLIREASDKTRQFDALICPTVPTIAPTIDSLKSDAEYLTQNALLLRNPSLFNFLDRCAISIPCHEENTPPVGLMLSGENRSDRRLLAIAAAAEKTLNS